MMNGRRVFARARGALSILSVFGLVAGVAFASASPASATDITPTGLTRFSFAAGSYLVINAGLSTQQLFDLGPSTGPAACADGAQNNDAAPLGTVGQGGGTDGLSDYFQASADLTSGTATGGTTTSIVDTTQAWTTNQWQGKSVWITAGPGTATPPAGAHIVSNTATTLTLSANSPSTGVAGFTTAPGAGSTYDISNADPECVSAADNSELATGLQPVENVVIEGTVNADGSMSIPKTVRTSEAQAESLGGIYFPPGYIPDSTLGVITAGIQPAPTASPATPFAGTINIDTGAVSMPINIRVQLQGGSGLTALGTNCFVPSSSSSAGIPLNLTTGTTSPPAPNQPISGTPFDTHNGRYTAVDNSFAVGGAGSACALANLGASSINTAFGLPAAAGLNTAHFVLQTDPRLNYQETGATADAGPDQFVHLNSTVTLDGTKSFDDNDDPIDSYSWVQTGGPAVTLSDPTVATPTFTSDATDATYTFDLTVSSFGGPASTDSVTVENSANVAPVANAGANQTGKTAGTTVTLDATASSDANHDPLTYTWAQVANGAPTVTLSDPSAAKPTFVVPPVDSPGGSTFQFSVLVDDGFGGTDSASTSVSSVASTPSVGAPTKTRLSGSGTTFYVGDVVQLNAGAITNPDGTNPADYSYVWAQSSGRTTTLSSTTAQNPTFVVPPSGAGAGNTSVCTSGSGATSPTSANCPEWKVTVTKINTGKSSALSATLANYAATLPTRPVANAGGAQTVNAGDPVTLDGSASTQAQGHVIGYGWTQTAGPTVTLSDPTAQKPTFTPSTVGSYTFSLVVTDTTSGIAGSGTNGNTSTASTTNVTVNASTPPIADAGPDQQVLVGSPVALDGSGSSSPDDRDLTYSWVQTGGTTVSLSDPTSVGPTFTAPDLPDVLTFDLTVDDGFSTATSSVTVTVTNTPPTAVASASPASGVEAGDPVTLDGSASSDPDPGQTLTYSWAQTAGTPVSLSDATSVMPTFVAPPGPVTLAFLLTVDDGHGGMDSQAVSVTVGGIPGLDLGMTLTGTVKGQAEKSTFKATVKNEETGTRAVTDGDIAALVNINGVPVDPGMLTVTPKSVNLKAGKSATFTITWNHGDSLNAGDLIDVTACVSKAGDEHPENDCATVSSPNGIDLSVTVSTPKITTKQTSNSLKLTVANDGLAAVSPLRSSNVGMTVQVGTDDPVVLTPPVGKGVALNPGKTKSYTFAWPHAKLPAGTQVTVTATITVPGNTSASTTAEITATVM
jgi:K319L-like, PKD domain